MAYSQCGGPIEPRQNSANRIEMIKRDFHILEGWKVQQVCCAARINKDFVYIKIINTQGKYKRIIMRSDDPGRVYRWKGYGDVNWLNCCVALRGTDGVYPSSN